MTIAGARDKTASAPVTLDRRRVITLLLFEAAGCLMAVPSAEVARLVPSALDLWNEDSQTAKKPIELIDLDAHFGFPSRGGLWIEWFRGEQTRGLRVQRVSEVWPCALRSLSLMPAWLRSSGYAGPFWAVGIHNGEIFLVLDPTRLASF